MSNNGAKSVVDITRDVVARYDGKEGILVHVLQDTQKALGYLPEDALQVIADELHLSLAHVCGVASFYKHFYFKPRGRNVVRVCMGTPCHVRGAQQALEQLEKELKLKSGETSDDLAFTLETVNCVGCCSLAPVVVVNDRVVNYEEARKTIAALQGGNGQNE